MDDKIVLGKELILKLQGHYFAKFVLVVINFSKFNNYVFNKEHPIWIFYLNFKYESLKLKRDFLVP